jgi:hypothetical protein
VAIILIATEWGRANGGVNAFNHGLAAGLAAIQPEPVCCAVTRSDEAAVAAAAAAGVRLVPVSGTGADRRPSADAGDEVVAWLGSHIPGAAARLWVGHDLITGDAAVAAARRHGGTAALVHHADYLSYGNLAGGQGERTEAKHRAQMALFRSAGAAVFGVGPWLAGNAAALAGREAHMLVPGFASEEAAPGQAERLRAVVAGRFDVRNEPLKRALLAAAAFGEAVRIAGDFVPTLEDPALTVLGVEPDQAEAVEKAVRDRAGRPVTVVPRPFNPDPAAVLDHLLLSHLAIMPSSHEGFGLIGWEAIGAGVPLILGTRSGLLRGLDELTGVSAEGWVFPVRIDGRGGEVEEMAKAIVAVAKDIPKARGKAAALRSVLKARHGCTWENCAENLLRIVGEGEAGGRGAAGGATASPGPSAAGAASETRWLKPPPRDHFPLCTELSLSAGQGSSGRLFELIAELRFGVQELAHMGIEAQFSVAGVTVRVTSRHGRIVGERLGDRPVPGIEARAGGIFVLTPPDGGSRMPNKALGSETLCRIATPPGVPAGAQVEVTAAKRDIRCEVRSRHASLSRATEKVMGVFLKEAILKQESGHVVLSVAELAEAGDG